MEQTNARINDVHLTEDIFEAFICALFLESSYDKCKQFLISILEEEIDFAEVICIDDNYKEKIMQYFHKKKWKDPDYIESKLTQRNNTDVINQTFVVNLQNSDGHILGTGTGNTKAKAEQNAAYNTLIKFKLLKENDIENSDENDEKMEKIDYSLWFKDNDFINHILNEKNILINNKFVNNIFKKYNLNYKVQNISNFQLAMIHISYLEKTILKDKTANLLKDISPISDIDRKKAIPLQKKDYSRLGHLGNAVIHLILTQYLCKRYSSKDQGFLTKLRTKLERADTQAYLAKQLDLHKYAVIARNMEQNNARILDANLTKGIFEAFIGSLSLELNYDACYEFLIVLIEKEIDFAELLGTDDNYKEKIMQYFHKMKWKDLKYVDVKCDLELKKFIVHIQNQDQIIGVGTGNTKNKAEQDAAHDALIKLNVIKNSDNTNDFYGEISDND